MKTDRLVEKSGEIAGKCPTNSEKPPEKGLDVGEIVRRSMARSTEDPGQLAEEIRIRRQTGQKQVHG